MLVVVVVITASFSTSLITANRNLTRTLENDLSFAVEIADGLISNRMQLLKSNAETMAERLLRATSNEELSQIMMEHVTACADCMAQTVFDRSGVIAWYGTPISSDELSMHSKEIDLAFGGLTVISSPFYCTDTGEFVMHIYTPLGSERVLSSTMSGLSFSELIAGYTLWQAGSIYIIDGTGTIIADVDTELVLSQRNFIREVEANPKSASNENRAIGAVLQEMLSHEKGLSTYSYQNIERLCSFKRVSSSLLEWRVVVAAPLNESPRANVQNGLLLATLIFLLVGLAASLVLSKYVARPFKELEELHETVKMQNERTNLLLNTSPLGVCLWDKNYVIFECNEEIIRLFGAKDKKDCCERFHDFSPTYQPDGSPSHKTAIEYIKKAFDEGNHSFEWMHIRDDGSRLPAEVTLVRVEYESDYAVAGYIRDLREHKIMMSEIEQRDELLHSSAIELEIALDAAQKANSAKSDFLANMSHEMRTPLNAVIGLSELCLENSGLNEEVHANLEKIYNAGSTLLGTVNDILDISKIEAGKLELVKTGYDVSSLINDAVTQNVLRIGEKPVKFILDTDKDLFTHLYGDELRVRQIINNLLSNAIKYTDEGIVSLAMSCTRENDLVWLTITVQDTGRGIRPEDMERLFSDYAQLDLKSNRRIEGTGLGLSLTKKLAEMMGGSVAAESEYRKGSTFTARIQQGFVTDAVISSKVAESLKSFRYSDGRRNHHAQTQRIKLPYARVLVVDDNETNLDVAKGLMKPYDMQIDCVGSGQEAIDAIRANEGRYNAVFMDHMMPGMNGIEAVQHIRELGTEYAKTIPIIALTANAIAGNEEMFLRKGFQAFISKPIDTSRLDEAIRCWIRDEKLEQTLTEQGLLVNGHLVTDSHDELNRRRVIDRRSGIDRRMANMKFRGLDMKKGIERFGGNQETYLRILGSFVKSTRPLLESMALVNIDTLPDYAITVHGLKGASRGIAADMIGNSAENLERAARIGDFEYVSKHNKVLLDAAWSLVCDLEDMLGDMQANGTQANIQAEQA